MYELRLCVTKDCNFKCTYCRAGGEGSYNQNPIMTIDQIKRCISYLTRQGFDSIRITGGEPFVRKDLVEVINTIGKIDGINNVTMVTNGSLINADIIDKLRDSKLSSITVSLDTMNPVTFKSIVGVDCFDKVIENIILLSKTGIKTRINMVVTSENVAMLPELRRFCSQYGVDIKLLDLNNNGLKDWEHSYVHFDEIIKDLRKNCINEEIQSVRGNVGTPMNIFNFGNYNVIVKDSKKGTCYTAQCMKCKSYPCQTGVSSPIITHDGYIKLCNLGERSDFSILTLAEHEEKFKAFDCKYKALFFQKEWSNKAEEEAACC